MKSREARGKRTIFRALFVPLFLIMVLQAAIFYLAAVYGGIEESLSQNAADILCERLTNRKNEVETLFNKSWANLKGCSAALDRIYASYEGEYGARPFAGDAKLRARYLEEAAQTLIQTLRQNKTNGIFVILNDQADRSGSAAGETQKKYGLCIRDMDQTSNYSGTKDLTLERAPASIVKSIGCSLDSWWEALYDFPTREAGDYYYCPLEAAWDNPGADAQALAYFAGAHRISDSDPAVVSYSIPLIDETGYPYGVLGVELTTQYLGSLLPNGELNDLDKSCYVLALREAGSDMCLPVVGTGALYSRCFAHDEAISQADGASTGGFTVTGRDGVPLYGDAVAMNIYSNNNPFEDRELVLVGLVESRAMFAYIDRIKQTLSLVSLACLALGIAGLLFASRRFAAPITALSGRVRGMKPQAGFHLGRLGIEEIDQLVEAIETLNRNVSRDIARTEFFSRMSHDMRTPMNAIISFSSKEMLEGAPESVKDDYLSKIHASGEYLLGLINEVLDMTKIESNKTELRPEPIQAARLMDMVIPIIEKLAQKKGVSFLREIDSDEDLYVMADRQHLGQVAINLLSNAVRFTPEGGVVRLTVRMTGASEDCVRCRIVVADNGIGMSEAFMKNLYTPFEQENGGQEGTGLGLTIAKRLVELMGGRIDCASQKNMGTTFTITLSLPKCAAPENAPERKEDAPPTKPQNLEGMRVLVCEDHPLNTQIIRRLLERAGIEVESAVNGRAGVEAFAASRPGAFDAILMDIRMPVMDGLAAARAIRALDREDAALVPIIAMTANAFQEDVRASRAAGMNAHLSKPVEPAILYETLGRCRKSPN